MRSAGCIIAFGVVFPACAQQVVEEPESATAPIVRYVNSPSLRVTNPATSEGVSMRLWVSTDAGHNWQSGDLIECGQAVTFVAPSDGAFSLWVGPDGETPNVGSPPTGRFIVDTISPTIQVHELSARTGDDGSAELIGRATLVEEHISSRGVRLFFRGAGAATWTDGEVVSILNGTFRWSVPGGAPDLADVRLVATDLAGNSTISQRRAAQLRRIREPNAATQPAVGEIQSQHVATTRPSTSPEDFEDHGLESDATTAHLKQLAREFAATGRFDLAAARFAEASRIGGDADSLAAWGDALVQTGALNDAQRKFEFALDRNGDMLQALMGLGDIAERRGDYPDAAAWFRKAVERHAKSPEAWLRLGDAANRAGDADEARRAWQRAADYSVEDSTTRSAAERRLRLMRNLGQ